MIVKSQVLKLPEPFITEKGGVIKEAVVAYEEYGNKEGPTVFITHGGLSSHHAAGRYTAKDPLPGFWNDLIGPGKAIDTDRFRALSANSLGSMYGSSSPLTLNPVSGRHYGPEFPEITLIDMVRYHKAFLDQMGVSGLFMMAGPSMGSLQALQMAALYPDYVDSVVAVATAGRMTPSGMCIHHFMINALQMDPAFNNGRYEIGAPKLALRLKASTRGLNIFPTDNRQMNIMYLYPKNYPANTIFVPDIFSKNLSGISFSKCIMALRPVQWVGTTYRGLSVFRASVVGSMIGSKSAPVR